VRRLAPLALLALAAAGCGGDGETTTVTVTTTVAGEATAPPALPSPLPEDGVLPVDEFNAYAQEVEEPWERDLASVTSAFVDAGATDSARRTFDAVSRDEGATATATLVLDGLFDDSVRARRYDLELRRRQNGTWELVSATWSQACRARRGHQDFAAEACA
jgi:hypothetical protein